MAGEGEYGRSPEGRGVEESNVAACEGLDATVVEVSSQFSISISLSVQATNQEMNGS
jgi:hypothetical protein